MAEQPQLLSPQSPDGRPDSAPTAQQQTHIQAQTQAQTQAQAAVPAVKRRQASSAMVRIESIIRILVLLYLGVIVLAMPWTSFWTQNNLFTYSPALTWFAANGFVRGLVSGLGLLNIILAVVETRRSRVLS
jgi:hypothetical protein